MAIEKVIDIQIKGNIDEVVGSLKSQLKEAQAEVASLSDKFGVTSDEAAKAAMKAAELADKIGDASALTAAFNPDAKFKAVTSSLAGVASGFGAIQSSMALFGAESENVEKTLLKVQSAMQLTQFLQQSGESIDSFQQLGAVIQSSTTYQKLNTIATAAAAAVQKLFTGAVNTTATSFNVLKTAIVSTGIGALVVGIGYLISKMNESADATEKLTIEQEQLNKQLEITKKLTDDNAKSIDYDTQIKLANAKKVGASEKELLRIQLDGYEAKGKANAKEIEDIQNTQNNQYNLTKEQNKRIQDLREQNQDLQRQGNVAIANLDADLANKQREANKKSQEENAANRKKTREEREEERKKYLEETQTGLQVLNQAVLDNEAQKKLDKLALKDEQLALLEEGVAAEQSAETRITDNAKVQGAARIKITELEAAAKTALFQKTADVLNKGADLLGKNTAAGKAMAAAAALINTYQGITAELATKTVTPFEIGLKIANVAIIAATGFKAVKDILAVKVPGGGGGGSAPSGVSAAGGGAPTAPSFNVVGASGTNQLAQSIGAQQQQPIRTYVVSNDVTTAQSLQRNIIQSATIGG